MQLQSVRKLNAINSTNYRKYAKYILVAAFLIRFIIALSHAFWLYEYDGGLCHLIPLQYYDFGQYGYIKSLAVNKAFPEMVTAASPALGCVSQTYQPPVFYILSALVKILVDSLGFSELIALECIQLMNMMISFCSFCVCLKMLEEFDFSFVSKLNILILCAFSPIFLLIGLPICNDCLMTFFCLLAILYTLRWRKDPTWKNTLLIMVFLVLGMLTKTSAVLIAPAIGAVFLHRFIKNKNERLMLLRKFVVFAVTSIPLGLSWLIRNKVKYDMSFSFVPKPWDPLPEDISALSRLGLPSIRQLTNPVVDFFAYREHSNIWGQLFHTFTFPQSIDFKVPSRILAISLLWTGIILYLLLLYLFVRYLISKAPLIDRIFLGTIHFFILFMALVFAFKYPYICSVNFRYIVVIYVVMMFGAFQYVDKNPKYLKIVTTLACLFCLQSFILYILPG